MEYKKKGTLFLIVGNSGSGKDSIIKKIIEIWPVEKIPLRVATRYITRPSHESEPYISIDPDMFSRLKSNDNFFLSWNSYRYNYGIGKEIVRWISEGIHVMVNVSRNVIPEARKKIASVKVVFVSVPLEIATKRLKKRLREPENGDEIKMRLLRARENQHYSDADFVIENSGPLDQSALMLYKYMLSVV